MRPESEKNLYPPLFLAKDARETRKLLAEGTDPNFCMNMGRTALCFAHSPRQAEVLIRAGADINGNDMTSPLHHISDPDTMLFLISKGANVNKQAPAYPVLWCLTPDGEVPANWGYPVVIGEKEDEQ